MINLRDKGASIWENWSPPARSSFVLIVITLAALLPFAGDFGPTSFLNTPISSYQAVLVYPIALFVLLSLIHI
jgi:branched-chain amino acid transport system permease protein